MRSALSRVAMPAIVALSLAQSSVPAARAEPAAVADAVAALGYEPAEAPVSRGAIGFTTLDESPLTIGDFAGKVVLVNLWATWCAPCVREMPSLDRLQARLGGPDFAVLALSQDHGGAAVVSRFFERYDITALTAYLDPGLRASSALDVSGLPTSVLIDRDGREVGRVVGPAEWDSEAAVGLIRHYLEAPATTSAAAD